MAGLSLIKNAAAVYVPSCERGGALLMSETFVDMGIELVADVEALVQRLSGAAGVIDAAGCVAVPGLMDLHVGPSRARMQVITHRDCAEVALFFCST